MRSGFAFAVCCLLATSCESAGTDAGDEGDGSAAHAGSGGSSARAGSDSSAPEAGSMAAKPPDADPNQSDPIGDPPEDGSGQTGSIGSTPVCDAAQCEEEAAGLVATLAAPAGWSRTFEDGHCDMVGIVGVASGNACICDTGDGGSIFIGPAGAGCFALGRAGDCLWADDEWSGCSSGAGDPCAASCEELEDRYAADAATEFDVELRHSECGAAGYCHSVLRIGDDCYADRSYENGKAYDCAQSDAEILEQHLESQKPEPVPSCDEIDPDLGGTCAEPAPNDDERDCAPRAPDEWQGMRVCGPYPPCERLDGCGLALACIDQLCSACTEDAQCAAGEGCALDHCVLLDNLGCRSRSDCSGDALCILSGYTGGTARSNEDMRAYCLSPSGGSPQAGG